jgi:hypothetical protein
LKKLVKTYVKRVATRYARTNFNFFSLNSDDHKFFFSIKFSLRFSLFSASLNLALAPSCHFAILQIQFFLFKRLWACRYKNSSKKLWWCSRYGLAFFDACSTFNKNRSTGCKKLNIVSLLALRLHFNIYHSHISFHLYLCSGFKQSLYFMQTYIH